jgi:septum formation protein
MGNPLQEKLLTTNIILASGSPRRKELLKGLDVLFSIQTKEVDEIYPSNLKKEAITDFLSLLKADAFTELKPNDLIITADTIVWFDDNALMKPKDKEDAIHIIKKLSGRYHEVFTSVCLKSAQKTKVFSDITKVFFKNLSDEEISYYVEKYKPYDKAGAYGAQDWIGYIAIDKIEGSYYNVMGLPVHKLYKELMLF